MSFHTIELWCLNCIKTSVQVGAHSNQVDILFFIRIPAQTVFLVIYNSLGWAVFIQVKYLFSFPTCLNSSVIQHQLTYNTQYTLTYMLHSSMQFSYSTLFGMWTDLSTVEALISLYKATRDPSLIFKSLPPQCAHVNGPLLIFRIHLHMI